MSELTHAGKDSNNAADFGRIVELLWSTIEDRRDSSPAESYTAYLLNAHEDKVLKKIGEEATEVVLAAKDLSAAQALGTEGVSEHGTARDHLCYETSDLLYHLLAACARWGITPNDLARELENRFKG